MEFISVQVTGERLSRVARGPKTALVELVRNAIDADAHEIDIDVELASQLSLDGKSSTEIAVAVQVRDDGHGMSFDDARGMFARWGDSWKASAHVSRTEHRRLIGKNGEGRFAAYGLGDSVQWISAPAAAIGETHAGAPSGVKIQGLASRREEFAVDSYGGASKPGTVVTIEQLTRASSRWLLRDSAIEQLIPPLALALRAYPVTVRYRDQLLAPASLIDNEAIVELPEWGARLLIVEWKRRLDNNKLLWCDDSGMSYHEEDPESDARGFHYTAYVQWAGARAAAPDLALREGFAPELAALGTAANAAIEAHFDSRLRDRRRELVDELRAERSYPYEGEPADEPARIERELFDVVAVSAAPTLRKIKDRSARKLTLQLLREALATDPGRLRSVLEQVLDLDPKSLAELHGLLDRTSLAAVIRVSRDVLDRLEIIQGLRALLFDAELRRTVLERQHLQGILAENTWLFGEQFGLFGNDETLKTVLKRHVAALGRDDLVDSVGVPLGDDGSHRLDFALGRALPGSEQRLHVLVVEIKRPSLILNRPEAEQLVGYATALTADREYAGAHVTWDFLLVGTEIHKDLGRTLNDGVHTKLDGQHAVSVRTWAQVLQDCEFRLNWLKQSLDIEVTRDGGLAALRSMYAHLLPPKVSE